MPKAAMSRAASPVEQSGRQPLVWLLMGTRTGDNNQLRALAEALGYPFEAKRLTFNQLRRFPFLRRGLTILDPSSRGLIAPPWPDLAICVGYGSVPVARFIRQQSGGRTRLVHIGNPRTELDDFDLRITTPQYARRATANLLPLPLPIGNPAKAAQPTRRELDWLEGYPRPRWLVAVGGPARHWRLDDDALAHAINSLAQENPQGSLIVATSPRTGNGTRRVLDRVVRGERQAVVHEFPGFATLLASSDRIYVTADSVSMLSEAILTGKPVGMIPIRRSLSGLIALWLWEKPLKRSTFPDFTNFWNLLRSRGLVGTVSQPIASRIDDTVGDAVTAVQAIMAQGSD